MEHKDRNEDKQERERSSEHERQERSEERQEQFNRFDPDRSSGTKGGLSQQNVPDGFRERCFPAKTRIEMADGSGRPISKLQVGDWVRCWDTERSVLVIGRVELVLQATVNRLIRLNECLAASPAHRILTLHGYLRFDEIRVGTQLFSLPGRTSERVSKVEVLSGAFPVFNLVVEKFACFFAEGLLVEDQVGVYLAEELALVECCIEAPE
jgi:hypothetical protein